MLRRERRKKRKKKEEKRIFFFFKQKTAYEIKECDWSSDVCSSDLGTPIEVRFRYAPNGRLSVTVNVAGTDRELSREITRENSLSQMELDRWRGQILGTR